MSIGLEDLVAGARECAAGRRARRPARELRRLAEDASGGRESGRLRRALSGSGLSVIAEIKGASPSAGTLRAGIDPAAITRGYAAAGASAVSVLTEERHFGGSLDHLRVASAATTVPVLRKDFIDDEYLVWEAAEAGAAAVLLIADVLDAERLQDLVAVADSVGLDALVETHSIESLPAAVAAGSGLIGVNNRDLRTMAVDVEHSLRIASDLPKDHLCVSESGVDCRQQLARLRDAGYDAVLIGSHLMRSRDPAAALEALLATEEL